MRKCAAFAIIAAMLLAMPASAMGDDTPDLDVIGIIQGAIGALQRGYEAIQKQAQAYARRHQAPGSCRERAKATVAAVTAALIPARRASEIYGHSFDRTLVQTNRIEGRFRAGGETLIAMRGTGENFYAEIYPENEDGTVQVIFRGTGAVDSDIIADATQFLGLPTAYYDWAAGIVAQAKRRFPEKPVVAAGHSLGGGLAFYGALQNGTSAYIFDPAGLSGNTLAAVPASRRAAAAGLVSAFMARSGTTIDPVSALSLAGESGLLGQLYLVPLGPGVSPMALHDIGPLRAAMERIVARWNAGTLDPAEICADDLGTAG
jgi:hypothetical protein